MSLTSVQVKFLSTPTTAADRPICESVNRQAKMFITILATTRAFLGVDAAPTARPPAMIYWVV